MVNDSADRERTDPFGQAKYQVRFDWGLDGARRIARGADILVVVDALSFTTAVTVDAEHGVAVAPWGTDDAAGAAALAAELGGVLAAPRGTDGPTLSPASYAAGSPSPVVLPSLNGGAIARAFARDADVTVLAASLRNRSATARRILELQEQRGRRLFVAVVAAGERGADGARFAIEDQLVAGAVVDALVALGIDHTSPEAAVACAAYEGLRQASTHLIGASGSGAELAAAGFRDDVRLATQRDATELVPELRDGVFRA